VKNADPLKIEARDQVSSRGSSTSINKLLDDLRTTTEATVSAEELIGRPQLPAIIQEEQAAKAADGGLTLGVFVCGPLSMQNDVSNAVAEKNIKIVKGPKFGEVYMHSEQFSWA